MNADADQTRIKATSADKVDSIGSESPPSQSQSFLDDATGSTGPATQAISKTSSIATPPMGASGTVLPAGFDSDRTVISKETPVAAVLPISQSHLPPAEMGKLLAGQRLGPFEL